VSYRTCLFLVSSGDRSVSTTPVVQERRQRERGGGADFDTFWTRRIRRAFAACFRRFWSFPNLIRAAAAWVHDTFWSIVRQFIFISTFFVEAPEVVEENEAGSTSTIWCNVIFILLATAYHTCDKLYLKKKIRSLLLLALSYHVIVYSTFLHILYCGDCWLYERSCFHQFIHSAVSLCRYVLQNKPRKRPQLKSPFWI
jgi:hypothetical protein